MKPGLYVATVHGVEGVTIHGPDPDGEYVILSHLEDPSLDLYEACYVPSSAIANARPLNSWNLPWVYQAGAMEPDEYIDERKWTDLDVVEVLSEGWSE